MEEVQVVEVQRMYQIQIHQEAMAVMVLLL